MAEERRIANMLWPRWASWALIGVALTTLLTVGAVLNDVF